jgi:hypothetical protein
MKSNYLSKTWRVMLGLLFVATVGIAASSSVQAQWPNQYPQYPQYPNQYPQYPNQYPQYPGDYRRNRDNRYGNITQVAVNQGFQDGIYTGSRDAQRGQSYNPQRSHFYRNGHGDNGGYGRIMNSWQYQQAYRNAFVQGYDQGFRRYGGYNRRRNNGNYGRLPFPFPF